MVKLILTFLFLLQSYAFGVDLYVKDGAFIQGYDPVSYIAENKAIKGQGSFALKHEGVRILFSTQENLNLFKASPGKYMPAYKGWCAYAMSKKGTLYKIDPTSFKVVEGKTYLFYKGWGPFGQTLKDWDATKNGSGKTDDKSQIDKANQNWNKLLSKEESK